MALDREAGEEWSRIERKSLMQRRRFIRSLTLVSLAASASFRSFAASARKMTMCLSPGSIGVSADQAKAIDLAQRHGFESVEPNSQYLAGLSAAQGQEVLAQLKAKGLVWGCAGLPVEFRRTPESFQQGLTALPKVAQGLQQAGVVRVGTWLMPGDQKLTYRANTQQHAQRLREVAKVLADHGQRLGLEYVGTPSVRAGLRFPFLHTLQETKELIEEIGQPNVGVVLDSWHWHMAGDTAEDLAALRNEQIISVDLNDAPAGVALEKQQDGQRELPCATGVIDVAAFLSALNRIGYDGPVRVEPFNKRVNQMSAEDACAAAAASLKKAMALIA